MPRLLFGFVCVMLGFVVGTVVGAYKHKTWIEARSQR